MKQFYIKAGNKEHFESLIKDYRKDGYNIITYGKHLCEMENGNAIIIIEW